MGWGTLVGIEPVRVNAEDFLRGRRCLLWSRGYLGGQWCSILLQGMVNYPLAILVVL